MPFVSKRQSRACWARKAKGVNGTWDCDEWAAHTDDPSALPERAKEGAMGFAEIGAKAAEESLVAKLAEDVEIDGGTVRRLAATVGLAPAVFVKRAYADPDDFLDFLRASAGVKQAGVGGFLTNLLSRMRRGAGAVAGKVNSNLEGTGFDAFARKMTPEWLTPEFARSTPARRAATTGLAGVGLTSLGGLGVSRLRGGGPAPAAGAQVAGAAPGAVGGGGTALSAAPVAAVRPPQSPSGSAAGPAAGGMSPAMKALLVGGGLAGGGLLASRLLRGRRREEEKEAAARDLARDVIRRVVVKRAADAYRRRAVASMVSFLDKQAALIPPRDQAAVRTIQASLARGESLGVAVKHAFPAMGAEDRGALARQLADAAAAHCKAAESAPQPSASTVAVNGPETYTGEVGVGPMRSIVGF